MSDPQDINNNNNNTQTSPIEYSDPPEQKDDEHKHLEASANPTPEQTPRQGSPSEEASAAAAINLASAPSAQEPPVQPADVLVQGVASNDDTSSIPPETPSTAAPFVNVSINDQQSAFHNQLMNCVPVQLEWRDINYDVKIRQGCCAKPVKRTILKKMSGYVAPGEVLAIMGPSGAGKTSLLNILSQRVKSFKGQLVVNGQTTSKALKQFRSASAFVQQDDVLMGNLTVREILIYASLLRLPTTMSLNERLARVQNVMDELGLTKCKDTKVGIPGFTKGISGGERKRLAIAVELLTSPSVLFLDEPTTGLDARTALNIMETIGKLAKSGRTIVLTIHQPRSDIVSLFDKLLVLARGRVSYFGKAADAPGYFSKLGHECPAEYNVADFLIDLVADIPEGAEGKAEQDKSIVAILDHYEANSKATAEQVPLLDESKDYDLSKIASYQSWWIVQTFVIFVRTFMNIVRDRMLTFARIFQTVAMSVLVGLIYLRIQYYQSNVQDRIGVLFFCLINQSMNSLFSAIQAAPLEQAVFMRERAAKTYRVSSYIIGKTIAEIPHSLFFPILFGSIIYWMTGLNPTVDRFFIFLLITIVQSTTAQSLGQLISSVAPKPEVALALAPVVTTIAMLFGGFYLNVKNIPVYFIWIYWISMFHFGYEAFVLNEFTGATFYCKDSELKSGVCPITSGADVISNLGMTGQLSNIWINLGFNCAIIVICRVLTFLAYRFLKKPRAA